MRFASKSGVFSVLSTFFICLLGVAPVSGQTTLAGRPPMSEEVFKNVQVLRGIPASEFMDTMGFFSASLTANCITCHGEASASSWENYAVDLPLKQTARKMVVMVNAINQANFGGQREVTCFTCHRGDRNPRVTPAMIDVYNSGSPAIEPDTLLPVVSDGASVDDILNRYVQALGGTQQLAKVTSFAAKGTSQAYAEDAYPVELFAESPNQLTMITHADGGDKTTAYDGRAGWSATPLDYGPIPLRALLEGDLAGAKLNAALWFPSTLKQALTQWRAIGPAKVNENNVQGLQGTADGGRTPVNLYFDSKSGLLVRLVRYNDTKVGMSATQIDYDDYRNVAGVKVPFRWTVSWLDGQTEYQLTDVQPNIPIDPGKFAKPTNPGPR